MSENDLCARCGHARPRHPPWCHDPYNPGTCNFQYDLCSCREFVESAPTATDAPREVEMSTWERSTWDRRGYGPPADTPREDYCICGNRITPSHVCPTDESATDARDSLIRETLKWARVSCGTGTARYMQINAALAHLDSLVGDLGEHTRKIEAYDAARAVVKTEGNSRAYYVLRAEKAEQERDVALANSETQARIHYEMTEELGTWQRDSEAVRHELARTGTGLRRQMERAEKAERELADAREIAHVAARLSQEEGFEGSPNPNEAELAKVLKQYLHQHNLASNDRHCVCSYCNTARAALSPKRERLERELADALAALTWIADSKNPAWRVSDQVTASTLREVARAALSRVSE